MIVNPFIDDPTQYTRSVRGYLIKVSARTDSYGIYQLADPVKAQAIKLKSDAAFITVLQ